MRVYKIVLWVVGHGMFECCCMHLQSLSGFLFPFSLFLLNVTILLFLSIMHSTTMLYLRISFFTI